MRQYPNQQFTQHYFNQESQDTIQYFSLQAKVAGYMLHLKSAKGVFSADEIDKGTSILLKHLRKFLVFGPMSSSTPRRFLDLGCGYGVVSSWLVAHYGATCQYTGRYLIDAVDSAPLAVDLATTNIRSALGARVSSVDFHVIQSDVLADKYFANARYNYIVTNPPFSAGKKVVREFIRQSFQYLVPGGELRCVAPTNRGAKSHITYTQEIFGADQVEVIALEGGYRIRKATKANSALTQ